MNEELVEISLEILHRKIAHFIRTNKEQDFNTFKEELKILTDEEEKICELDEETIKKTFDVYLKELKKE